jgi:hypothetical protein
MCPSLRALTDLRACNVEKNKPKFKFEKVAALQQFLLRRTLMRPVAATR